MQQKKIESCASRLTRLKFLTVQRKCDGSRGGTERQRMTAQRAPLSAPLPRDLHARLTVLSAGAGRRLGGGGSGWVTTLSCRPVGCILLKRRREGARARRFVGDREVALTINLTETLTAI
jgi:hypothetical protein